MPLQETLKSVIAQYNASQLLTMREVGLHLLNICIDMLPFLRTGLAGNMPTKFTDHSMRGPLKGIRHVSR